ncbi:MAG: NADAR family protein [archaeon]
MTKYTFFWRKESPFSQQHPSNFQVQGVRFNCAEQFMMYQKALLFGDNSVMEKILNSVDPQEQKGFGREIRGYSDQVWIPEREQVVYNGNYAKFTQNDDLYKIFMQTSGTTLVEASPKDTIYGIGLSADDPRALDEKT